MTTALALVLALVAVTPITPTERSGDISHMGDTPVPPDYLALPCRTAANRPCFIRVKLCGPAACVTMRQTDYGPSQRIHPNRIADVTPRLFEKLCGVPSGRGLCEGSWHVVGKAPSSGSRPTLPPTSTAPPGPLWGTHRP